MFYIYKYVTWVFWYHLQKKKGFLLKNKEKMLKRYLFQAQNSKSQDPKEISIKIKTIIKEVKLLGTKSSSQMKIKSKIIKNQFFMNII